MNFSHDNAARDLFQQENADTDDRDPVIVGPVPANEPDRIAGLTTLASAMFCQGYEMNKPARAKLGLCAWEDCPLIGIGAIRKVSPNGEKGPYHYLPEDAAEYVGSFNIVQMLRQMRAERLGKPLSIYNSANDNEIIWDDESPDDPLDNNLDPAEAVYERCLEGYERKI